MTLELIDPTEAYRDAFLTMTAEYQAGDPNFYRGNGFELARLDFGQYLKRVCNEAQGRDLPEGRVPQNTYWLLKDREDRADIIGGIRIRHYLTPSLEHHGGHIGYDIRPSARRQGYGTQQLALALDKARALGLTRVMLTCDVANIASARIIVANGGALESEGLSGVTMVMIARYWIEL